MASKIELMKSEHRKLFTREIQGAKATGAAWHVLARLMIRGFDSAEDDQEVSELRSAAKDVTGLSPQILKRYVALLRRTQKIAGKAGVETETLLSPVFNAQEVAARLYDRSPEAGIEALEQLKKGEVTLAQLRTRLAGTPASAANPAEFARSAVVRTRTLNTDLIDRALKNSAEHLWGKESELKRRPRLMYFGKFGYEVIGDDGSVLAGVDVMFPDPRLNQDYLAGNVAPSLLLAPFFKKFYFAFAPTTDDGVVGRAEALLDWLGFGWVGIVKIQRDGSIDTVRKPVGSPVPDQTGKYEALKRKFPAGRNLQGTPDLDETNAD